MFFFTPFIRNPITDLTGPIMTAQLGQRCAEFEMRMMNCFEAYGNPLGYQKCQDFYEDFKECCTREKQMARIYAIQKERSLQAKIQGKGKEYENPPVMHTF